MNPTETTPTANAENQAPEKDLAKLQLASEKIEVAPNVETNVEKEKHLETAEHKEEKLDLVETAVIIVADDEESQEALDGRMLVTDRGAKSVNQEASAENIKTQESAVADDEATKNEASDNVIQP